MQTYPIVYAFDPYGFPLSTETGPICGCCRHHHESAAAIRLCYQLTAEAEADIAADQDTERRYERALEDRGYDEARAQEAIEAARGVIDFQNAYRAACPGLFAGELT